MSLSEILYELLNNIYPISGYLIVGLVLLVLSGLLYTFSELQLNLWQAMWRPTNVVHQQVPAATDQVRDGIRGCILGVTARILQWVCFIMGLDFIVFQARNTQWLIETLSRIQTTPW